MKVSENEIRDIVRSQIIETELRKTKLLLEGPLDILRVVIPSTKGKKFWGILWKGVPDPTLPAGPATRFAAALGLLKMGGSNVWQRVVQGKKLATHKQAIYDDVDDVLGAVSESTRRRARTEAVRQFNSMGENAGKINRAPAHGKMQLVQTVDDAGAVIPGGPKIWRWVADLGSEARMTLMRPARQFLEGVTFTAWVAEATDVALNFEMGRFVVNLIARIGQSDWRWGEDEILEHVVGSHDMVKAIHQLRTSSMWDGTQFGVLDISGIQYTGCGGTAAGGSGAGPTCAVSPGGWPEQWRAALELASDSDWLEMVYMDSEESDAIVKACDAIEASGDYTLYDLALASYPVDESVLEGFAKAMRHYGAQAVAQIQDAYSSEDEEDEWRAGEIANSNAILRVQKVLAGAVGDVRIRAGFSSHHLGTAGSDIGEYILGSADIGGLASNIEYADIAATLQNHSVLSAIVYRAKALGFIEFCEMVTANNEGTEVELLGDCGAEGEVLEAEEAGREASIQTSHTTMTPNELEQIEEMASRVGCARALGHCLSSKTSAYMENWWTRWWAVFVGRPGVEEMIERNVQCDGDRSCYEQMVKNKLIGPGGVPFHGILMYGFESPRVDDAKVAVMFRLLAVTGFSGGLTQGEMRADPYGALNMFLMEMQNAN